MIIRENFFPFLGHAFLGIFRNYQSLMKNNVQKTTVFLKKQKTYAHAKSWRLFIFGFSRMHRMIDENAKKGNVFVK